MNTSIKTSIGHCVMVTQIGITVLSWVSSAFIFQLNTVYKQFRHKSNTSHKLLVVAIQTIEKKHQNRVTDAL